MTRVNDTAVLVAGAGPAGLAAAAELGHRGIDCIVVEPRTEVSHSRPRAKTTSARTMEHLRRWGIAGKLRAAAPLPVAWSQRVTFCESLSGARLTDFDGAFGLTTERDERFAECGQQVPQPVVEEVLRAHLRELPSVGTRFGEKITCLTQDDAGVTTTVRRASGEEYKIRSNYLLGCDGGAGVTRDQLGSRFTGRSDSRPNFNVVFRAPGLGTHLGPAVQYWVLGDVTSGLLGRLDLAGTWWAIMPGIDHDYGIAHATELIQNLIGAPVEVEPLATDRWQARMLVADRFAADRVFLVGESAHLNPPWGGHGYNTCVGDAVNVGWKLAAVEQGWAPPRLLASYESERRGVAERTVASTLANLANLATNLPRDEAAIRRAKYSEFNSLGLVLGYSYAGSPIVQEGPAAEVTADVTTYVPVTDPGARLPHHWRPDGASLYDCLGQGFTLLCPPGAGTGAGAGVERRAKVAGLPLKRAELPAGYPWPADYLLVRPDQHIAWRTEDPAKIDLALVTGGELPQTS